MVNVRLTQRCVGELRAAHVAASSATDPSKWRSVKRNLITGDPRIDAQSVEHANALLVAASIGAVDGLVNVTFKPGDEQMVNGPSRLASTAIDAFDLVADRPVVMLLGQLRRGNLSWVNAYTRNHEIPITGVEKDVPKKDGFPLCGGVCREKAEREFTTCSRASPKTLCRSGSA
jgi:hypothetical protein